MTKISNHSTPKKKVAKVRTRNEVEVTPESLRRTADHLVDWAMKQLEKEETDDMDGWDVMDYPILYNIPLMTYRDWVKDHFVMAQADALARELIGKRRDRYWRKTKHDGYAKYIGAFKGTYHNYTEKLTELKAKADAQADRYDPQDLADRIAMSNKRLSDASKD